jgi:Polyketide cyclase / dehydrase and lipid transport
LVHERDGRDGAAWISSHCRHHRIHQWCDLPVPPPIAWAYVTDVEKKMRWQRGLDGMTMSALSGGRIGTGSIQHCAHGKGSTVHDIVDWRPFDYVTYHIRTPLGTVVRQTAEFTPLANGGTHLSLRSAQPESSNRVAQALVRMMMPLVAAKQLPLQRASKLVLEKPVADVAVVREPAIP